MLTRVLKHQDYMKGFGILKRNETY